MFRSFSVLALLLIGSVLLPLAAEAQFIPNDPNTIILSISPETPRPHDQITISVGSNLLDLSTAQITIYVNGAVVEEGARIAAAKLGGPGTATKIRAVVVTAGGTYSAERTLVPGDIMLIVEPISTAHPFYDGAPLLPSEGNVRLIALADLRTPAGTKIPNSETAYTWKVGSKQLLSDSGLGKNILIATAPPQYRDADVTVTATSRDQTIVAQAEATLSPVEPIVRIYRNDPLQGLTFANALSGTATLRGAEETFRAVPYFFKVKPSISWKLNGNERGTTPDLTVRATGGSGTGVLNVSADDLTAYASETISLRFAERRSSNIFGF